MKKANVEDCDKEPRILMKKILEAMGFTQVEDTNGQCFYDFKAISPFGTKVCIELKSRSAKCWDYSTWFIGAHKLVDFMRYNAQVWEEGLSDVSYDECFDKFIAISIYPGLKRFTIANVLKDSICCNRQMCKKTTLIKGGSEDKVPKAQLYFNFKNNFEYVEVGGQFYISRTSK